MALPTYTPPREGRTEADAVAEITAQSQLPQFPCGIPTLVSPLVFWPREQKVQNLEEFMSAPVRKRAQVTVRDHMSFIDYVDKHREPGTTIFSEVNDKGGSFTAVIDYHHASHPNAVPEPRWRQHSCKYVAEHTPEWVRWMAASGKPLGQTEMALFIEDNLYDIINPAAARMLELVKTLNATQGVEFKSAVRLDNGDRQLHYAHQTVAKAGVQGDMEIPEHFKLRFSVFMNGPAYDIDCRFRYQIKEGALRMAFEVERPHKIIDLALTEARTAIQTTLKLPVLLGSVT